MLNIIKADLFRILKGKGIYIIIILYRYLLFNIKFMIQFQNFHY